MNLILYAVVAIALIGAAAGFYGKIHHDGYAQGRAETQAEWDAANRKAADEEAARKASAELTAKASAAELAAAQQTADDYKAKWTKERNRHANQTLAGCSGSPTANATGGASTLPAVRFSLGFLRDWNGAWTGGKGEPLLPNQPALAGNSADTLTAIGPGEVLDNQAANADLCSADRRKLNTLIDQIEKLRDGWK